MTNQQISSRARRQHVAQWRADGALMQSYADQHDLPGARLNYWIMRLEREAQMSQLVPVRIQQAVTTIELALHSPFGWTTRIDARVEPAWLVPCCRVCGESAVLFGVAGNRAG